MSTTTTRLRSLVLLPEERISEVLFGLIMVITFTGSLSIAEGGGNSAGARDNVRTMLVGALGCNIAWGIIDAVMYLMAALAESARNLKTFRAVRTAKNSNEAASAIGDAVPPLMASILTEGEYTSLHQRLAALPEPPKVASLKKSDWLGAVGVFLWVFCATFPVTLPFMLMQNAGPALRVSNGVAVGMLFALGFAYGRSVGRNPWLVAVGMVVVGLVLVGMTIALGG